MSQDEQDHAHETTDPQGAEAPAETPTRRPVGFAAMTPERRREVASEGGRTARDRGTAHRFDSASASAAGRVAHERGTANRWTPEQAGAKGGAATRRKRP